MDKEIEDRFNLLEKKYKDLEERYRESGGLKCVRDRGLIKERIEKLFKTVHGIYPDKVDTYEEIMRKHLKSHIVVAREQLTDKDKLTIFREFDEAIQKQLEKLDSHIKVTISRNDGEKGENSKDVISSKENNLSAPERRIDGDSKPQTWRGEVPLVYANEKKGDFDRGKDGEKEVEEMSNKNLCREESNIDILPPSKPSKECTPKNLMNAFGLKEKELTLSKEEIKAKLEGERYRILEECGVITREKEPTDDVANITQIIEIYDNGHEHEFYPDTHVVVKKADLEKWNTFLTTLQKKVIPPFEPPEITDETRDWMIFACDEIRHEIMKYLGEEK